MSLYAKLLLHSIYTIQGLKDVYVMPSKAYTKNYPTALELKPFII